MTVHEYVNDSGVSGVGYNQEYILYTSNHFLIDAISVSLIESLALEEWLENARNAIVASIDSITITTISSCIMKSE